MTPIKIFSIVFIVLALFNLIVINILYLKRTKTFKTKITKKEKRRKKEKKIAEKKIIIEKNRLTEKKDFSKLIKFVFFIVIPVTIFYSSFTLLRFLLNPAYSLLFSAGVLFLALTLYLDIKDRNLDISFLPILYLSTIFIIYAINFWDWRSAAYISCAIITLYGVIDFFTQEEGAKEDEGFWIALSGIIAAIIISIIWWMITWIWWIVLIIVIIGLIIIAYIIDYFD